MATWTMVPVWGDIGDGEAQLCHQAGITGSDRLAVHLGGDAVSAQLLHVGDAGSVDVLAVSSLDAQGDGVLRPALGQRSGFHEAVFGTASTGQTLTTLKVPWVRVPVLSKTTTRVSASSSR